MGGLRNWTVAEVTRALRSGENLLALRLPQNFLGYRVYLTGQAPKQYPYLDEPALQSGAGVPPASGASRPSVELSAGGTPAPRLRAGSKLNAQWADFTRWQAWTRQESVQRSSEAIREVDPDRSVICMAPDAFIGGLEELARITAGISTTPVTWPPGGPSKCR